MKAKYQWTIHAAAQVCLLWPFKSFNCTCMITLMSCSSPQAIGYFVSLETDAFNPPVGCVISKDTSDVIIFPFRTEESRLLINAVSIPFGALQDPFYSSVVCLLVLITHRKNCSYVLSIQVV